MLVRIAVISHELDRVGRLRLFLPNNVVRGVFEFMTCSAP